MQDVSKGKTRQIVIVERIKGRREGCGMEPKLIFDVINQHITRKDNFKPVRGSKNYLHAQFNFRTEDWSGKTKTAIFHGFGIKPISVILDGAGGCLIPWQAVDCQSFIVSVFGGDLITANKVKVKLEDTGYKEGETPSQPDTDAYTQILGMLNGKGDGLSYVGNVLKLLSGKEEIAQVTIPGSGSGQDAREIELRNSGTHIQWRHAGDAAWTNLIALGDIKGDPGERGAPGEKGEPGKDGGYYRPDVDGSGNLTWTASKVGMPDAGTAKIKGEPGEKGDPGEPGKTPVKGRDYFTEGDISEIEEGLMAYIDTQIGGALNGSY